MDESECFLLCLQRWVVEWLRALSAVQLSVFGTSVFAARHMAAHIWPGFATGGVLWFPDLTKAAAVIHWGQVYPYTPPMGMPGGIAALSRACLNAREALHSVHEQAQNHPRKLSVACT